MHIKYGYMHEVNLSSIDLNLLVALDALLHTGSVTRAAERIRLSQPAMSRALERLRDLFADPLLVRQGRVMSPTPRADQLSEPVALLLSQIRDLVRAPRLFDPLQADREFRLMSSDYAQVVILGSVVEKLRVEAPRVVLTLLELQPDPVSALASGSAELLFGPPDLCPSWCESKSVLSDQWVCVCRKDLTPPRTLRRYLDLEHISVGIETRSGSAVDAWLQGNQRSRTIRAHVPDFAGALFVAAQSSLVATVPRPVGLAGARLLQLSLAKTPFPVQGGAVAMIWPRRLSAEPAHLWLRQTVEATLGLS
jgi:DNA-binding transcriptional LysR family regulator